MKSRKAFRKAHRIRFVYTPKHTSWLNQVALRSILVRKLLKRGNFKSVEDFNHTAWPLLIISIELWPSLSNGPLKVDLRMLKFGPQRTIF